MGIDPGISPGVAVIDFPGYTGTAVILEAEKLLDEEALYRLINKVRPDMAVTEHVHAMPQQGVSSTAKFCTSYGIIRGMLRGRGIAYYAVSPDSWKKALFTDRERGVTIEDKASRKKHQKASAVAFAGRMCPAINLVEKGCRTPNHNIAEAICLAVWGYQHGT